jgi:hypothetical protein
MGKCGVKCRKMPADTKAGSGKSGELCEDKGLSRQIRNLRSFDCYGYENVRHVKGEDVNSERLGAFAAQPGDP